MNGLTQDLRYATRTMVKAPGFTLVAVATLALGISANTAIFSVVNALLLRPLPYPDAGRLVTVWQDLRPRGGPAKEWATPGNYFDWQADTAVFAGLSAVSGWPASLSGAGEAEPLVGEQVTHDYFDVLGVRPSLGRPFRAEDDVPNAPRVAVISHALWARRFGGEPSAVGRMILVSGEPHELIGVMPDGFRPGVLTDASVWRPLRLNASEPSRGAVFLRTVGRLRDGVSLREASVALAGLAGRLERAHPDTNARTGINLVPLHEQVVGDIRLALLVLLGAVGFVLLIACVNVANLLLARASGRGREIAVRMALGAARARVMRQLLTESLLLATLGGAVGVLFGVWGVSALVAMAPAGVPRVAEIGINGGVVAFAVLLTAITGVLFGLAPAWQASRGDVTPALKEGGRGSAGVPGQRTRRALIVAEIALALILLVGGGLLLRTFLELQRVDLGFDPSNVIVGYIDQPAATYKTGEQLVTFFDRVLEGASALPGVRTAALASVIPFGGDNDVSFEIEGRPVTRSDIGRPVAWYRVISATYFSAIGIPLRNGRLFAARESAPVIVINETMSRKFWPGENALGRRLRTSPRQPWFTIVGVTGDVKVRGAQRENEAEMYVPYWQMPEAGVNIVLKAAGDPGLLAGPMKQVVHAIDPEMPVSAVAPMSRIVAESIQQQRFFALIVGLFACLALVLSAVGIYGVMSYAVAQRAGEIGVRLALGAAERQIFALVIGDSLRLTALGLGIGAAGALAVGRGLQRLLFGVHATDPLTFAATSAVLLLVALAASYVPARRAMRVDPMTAVRSE